MIRKSRLNVQGLARRDPGLMTCILPDTGKTVISIDLSAGEPSVTTHFSQDPNYRAATFDMIGKAPFYKDGLLYLDDIYLMTMSASPIGHNKMTEIYNSKFNGLTFAEQWLKDPEIIKKQLKTERQLHKILCLGLGYGMGAKKLVKTAYEAGHTLSNADARLFHRSYWQTFSGVKSFADRLAAKVQSQGYLINPFGYRLVPEPHKAFNFFIQSSVSGIMHILLAKVSYIAPYATFITCIHDELLMEVDDADIEQFRLDMAGATASLNSDLKWSVAIRTGFVSGSNWYEAK